MSRNLYKDIILVSKALKNYSDREMIVAEMVNPLVYLEGENKAIINREVLDRTFLHL